MIPNKRILINKTELNVLYHVAGYIISNIKKNQNVCNNCINKTISRTMVCHSYNLLTRIRANKYGRYCFVNNETFRFFIQMEIFFKMFYKKLRIQKINLKNFFVTKYQEIQFSLPECHNLKKK